MSPPAHHWDPGLVLAHDRYLRALARSLIADAQVADDLAQQTWLQAYAGYPRLRSAENLRGWLLTITYRCATDSHRGRARRPVTVDDRSLADASAPVPPTDPPDAELWARVAGLPVRQREALVLRYVGDLDHATIAATLGITTTTSRRLVSDALATLRSSR